MDQSVSMFTPCSAASIKLKNILLPRTQRSVGLPRVAKIELDTSDSEAAPLTMPKIAQDNALRAYIINDCISKSRRTHTKK